MENHEYIKLSDHGLLVKLWIANKTAHLQKYVFKHRC
jgi:hypothetical protein